MGVGLEEDFEGCGAAVIGESAGGTERESSRVSQGRILGVYLMVLLGQPG